MLEIPLQGTIPAFRAGHVSLIAVWNNSLLLTYSTTKHSSFAGVMQGVIPDVHLGTETIFSCFPEVCLHVRWGFWSISPRDSASTESCSSIASNCMLSFSHPHSVLESYLSGGTMNDKSSLLRLSAVGQLEGPSSALWALTPYGLN